MATAALPRHTAAKLPGRQYDNYFFSAMALLILTTVFIGFARTYFLAGIFRAPLPSLLVHIHGAVFSTWILLLITQIALVSAGRVDIHRRLGLAGFALACLMVVLGVMAATGLMARGRSPVPVFDAQTFYAIPMVGILIFATLIFFAYRQRINPAAHKRLILIATISILDAPTGRPPFTAITAHPFMDSIIVYAFLLLIIAYDVWSTRKVHQATIWATAFVVVIGQLRVPIGQTQAWHHFATWMQTLAR